MSPRCRFTSLTIITLLALCGGRTQSFATPGAGVCCVEEMCLDISFSDCLIQAGVFFPGAVIDDCPDICSTGACCLGSEGCQEVVSEEVCNGLGGTLVGIPSSCALAACGACCLQSAQCISSDPVSCVSMGGDFQGVGSVCEPIECPCNGDVDGDGITQVSDLVAVILDWNCGTKFGGPPPCDGDANGDGITNVQDLITIISNWNCGFEG